MLDNVKIGVVFFYFCVNNEFNENVFGKYCFILVNVFMKGNWENGIFVSVDLGYGCSCNIVIFDGKDNVFYCNIFNVGGNLGVNWDFSGWLNV